jgi:hypothetical protein
VGDDGEGAPAPDGGRDVVHGSVKGEVLNGVERKRRLRSRESPNRGSLNVGTIARQSKAAPR